VRHPSVACFIWPFLVPVVSRLMRLFLRYTVYTTTYIGVLDFTIMFSFRVRSIDPAKGLFLEQFIEFSPLCCPEHQIERSQR